MIFSKNNFFKIFLYLYTFLFIFNPSNFSSFNLIYLLSFFSILYFIFNRKVFFKYFKNKKVFSLLFLCVYLCVYMLALYMTGSEDALYESYVILIVIMAILCGLVIVDMFKKIYGFNFLKFIEFIIRVGLIQFFFVALSVFYPEFREWVLNTSRQEDLESISNSEFSGLRSFGLSLGYTSTLPMFMGVCSLLSFYFFIVKENIKSKLFYFFATFAFLISVVLNARIGLVPISICLITLPFFFVFNLRKKAKTLVFLILSVLVSFSLSFSTLLTSDYLVRFMAGLDEIDSLLGGKATGNFEALLGMWFFPDSKTDFIFGQGFKVFGSNSKGSDIGLVRDIYMYGFLNVLIVTAVLFYSSNPLLKTFKKYFGYLFLFSFVFSFFAFYFKGLLFSSNEVMNLFFILLVFCIFYNKTLSRDII